MSPKVPVLNFQSLTFIHCAGWKLLLRDASVSSGTEKCGDRPTLEVGGEGERKAGERLLPYGKFIVAGPLQARSRKQRRKH